VLRPLRKLVDLPAHRRRLLLWTAGQVFGVRLGLWLRPFRAVWRENARAEQPLPAWLTRSCSADDVCWSVGVACRYIPGATCLTRSLTLYGLLRRLGSPCELRVGVARTPTGALLAHAWVERDGLPLPGSGELNGYTPLPAFPREGP
jgi:hypothetical protein